MSLGKDYKPYSILAEAMFKLGMKCEKSSSGRHEWNIPTLDLSCRWCGFMIDSPTTNESIGAEDEFEDAPLVAEQIRSIL